MFWCGAGFVAFDTYKMMLEDQAGHISGPRTVIAGFGAGITESVLAVTPFESIKTTLLVLGPYNFSSIGHHWYGPTPFQNRWPQISKPSDARLPTRLQRHLEWAWPSRTLPGVSSHHRPSGYQFRHSIQQLYYFKAACPGTCRARGKVGNSEHVWNRGFCWVDHGVGPHGQNKGRRYCSH